MWISKRVQELLDNERMDVLRTRMSVADMQGQVLRLVTENTRLRSDMDWFKLRLNQVEKERGQLIQAALGIKIAVPEFVPTYENPINALSEMPDFSTVGGDAHDEVQGEDFSNFPGYEKSK